MNQIEKPLDSLREQVQAWMNDLAQIINSASKGKISPNSITLVGLAMHIPIAWMIANGFFIYSAVLLIIFGLFDALDGALARLQKKASNAGMLLDASTDRIKEVILYIGVAFALIQSGQEYWAVWAVAACGTSICVSYVKAKGETAVAGGKLSANEVNRLFRDGLGRFEIRISLLIVGLFLNRLEVALVVITVLSAYTATMRLIAITKKLS